MDVVKVNKKGFVEEIKAISDGYQYKKIIRNKNSFLKDTKSP